MADRFLFLDVETTDLNPRHAHLLEIGFVLCDLDLNEVDSASVLIKPREWAAMVRANFAEWMPEVVIQMHTQSGLIDAVAADGLHIDTAQTFLLEWLRGHELVGHPVAGSTVRFDRNFIEIHMPIVHQFLHYRCIDVSTLKELARYWAPDLVVEAADDKAHRALADCRASIEELKSYRANGVLGLELQW